jgi:hypothetical protein
MFSSGRPGDFGSWYLVGRGTRTISTAWMTGSLTARAIRKVLDE